VVVSQSQIEMDSSAIYINASGRLFFEDVRWRLAKHGKCVYETDLVPSMMKWRWLDFSTGTTLCPAFDEPPALSEMSRWVPTDQNITWDEIPSGAVDEQDLADLRLTAGSNDSIMVYQYA
jgi:hypothetical protein